MNLSMVVAIEEDLKSIVKAYGEARLKVLAGLSDMDHYSLTLFKSFLLYIKERKEEKLTFQELMSQFFTEELELDKKDESVRLSLTRRFYNLAKKHVRNPKKQGSLSPYLSSN